MRYAFDYALANGRKKVTAVHKANILKNSDGLFLKVAREVAAEYKDSASSSRTTSSTRPACSSCCTPSGSTCSCCRTSTATSSPTSAAGLIGGLGIAPGANIGTDCAVFEPVHGSAPKYTGKDMANPTAEILSAMLMLKHLGETEAADRVLAAVRTVIGEGENVTYDIKRTNTGSTDGCGRHAGVRRRASSSASRHRREARR